jgi:flagellar M-ring protein FliF
MVKFFGAPDYKPLMMDLEAQDAQAITAQLAAKKIAYQLTPDGRGINVPADQLDAARMEVASEGSPHTGRMGFELFDKSSWGQTEFDEKVNYQRALEGELERTIQTLNGVKSARVHLVMPTASVFLDRERAAKASVALRMKRGSLSSDQISAISRLVSGAVDNLSPRDVTIIDADSNESLGSHSGTLEGRELETELAKRLLATLGPAVGVENLRTSVNVEYDLTSTEQSQDKYDPSVSAVLNSQKTSEQVGSGVNGGVAGTSANLPNAASAPPQGAGVPDDGSQISSSENASFGVNKTVLHTVSPAGRIRRITAAILVNDLQDHKQIKGKWVTVSHKRTPAELQQIEDLARGVLGADKDRGDVVTVQNMAFDEGVSADTPLTLMDQVKTAIRDFGTPIRYASMLLLFALVWLLMFRPVQKQIVSSLKELGSGPAPALETTQAKAELASGISSASLESDPESARLKRELSDLVQAEPASMTRTLQTWLREDNA